MGADSESPGQLQHLAATKRMVFAHDVVPTGEETAGLIQMVEEQYRDLGRLQHEMDRWYVV